MPKLGIQYNLYAYLTQNISVKEKEFRGPNVDFHSHKRGILDPKLERFGVIQHVYTHILLYRSLLLALDKKTGKGVSTVKPALATT